jgi:hypothetical protein
MRKTFAILIASVLVASCASAVRVKPVLEVQDTPVTIAGGKTAVASTIKSRLSARGWKVISENANVIRAQFSKPNTEIGVHSVTIDVGYDADSVSIKYVDSENMLYEADGHKIHRNYNRWVANLERDLVGAQ